MGNETFYGDGLIKTSKQLHNTLHLQTSCLTVSCKYLFGHFLFYAIRVEKKPRAIKRILHAWVTCRSSLFKKHMFKTKKSTLHYKIFSLYVFIFAVYFLIYFPFLYSERKVRIFLLQCILFKNFAPLNYTLETNPPRVTVCNAIQKKFTFILSPRALIYYSCER